MRRARPADTTPEVWRIMCGRDRAMTVEERAAETISLTRALTAMSLAGIRAKYPDRSEDEVQYELARRRYGRAVADAAFGRHVVP